jgi:type II secretory ATPase GspE/PulE/Tfp pilus assembly ATPase PilB-like protein
MHSLADDFPSLPAGSAASIFNPPFEADGPVPGVSQPRTAEELWDALHQPHASHPAVRHLGQAVLQSGLVDKDTLRATLLRQQQTPAGEERKPLGRMLVDEGMLSEAQLNAVLTHWLGTVVVDPHWLPTDAAALSLVPRKLAQREVLLPLMLRDDTLVVLFAAQWDKRQMDELRFITQKNILPLMAAPGTLQAAQDRAYTGYTERSFGMTPAERAALNGTTRQNAQELLTDLQQVVGTPDVPRADVVGESDSVLVRLINTVIEEAISQRASDIHIEADEAPSQVCIRLRVDGELRPYLELEARFRFALVGRLKIMANLDISEHRRPQDGKIDFSRFGGSPVELRMVTVPTSQGHEDVVLRLLASGKPLPLDGIGLLPANLNALREAVHRPYGLVLICGPTGSGKTTTLHSVLSDINTRQRKIWTAEDPIEITQPGLRQVQVNPRIGWTFAAAMRTFLRADPDVIMIGEMRDEETARIAVEASLTGHLVLSTLHTNSAPESITRLLEIGLDPFNFSDSLLAILAQRLVRRLCTHCRQPSAAQPDQLAHLAAVYLGLDATGQAPAQQPLIDAQVAQWKLAHSNGEGGVNLYRHQGCPHCGGTGFKGRLGVHELMLINDEVRSLIRKRSSAGEMRQSALAHGMLTLRQDGIEKALQGLTEVSEVLAAANA